MQLLNSTRLGCYATIGIGKSLVALHPTLVPPVKTQLPHERSVHSACATGALRLHCKIAVVDIFRIPPDWS